MDDWFSNPQWWLSITVSSLVALVIPKVFHRAKTLLQPPITRTQGWFKSYYRHRRCKRLRKIKAARFDSLKINRAIALSYACFILFVIAAVASMVGFTLVPTGLRQETERAVVLGFITATPAFLFEFAWLTAASKVDDLLRYRGMIKRRHSRLF
ncbi:hypothetical protein [Pseudomonas syringae]|uniref:hypothetical protein n=1 Tax=Pseudomonas syringae TaxID=317 RepID=UPI001CA7E7BD|nr:hypothetical protein [Pseudomonas syringae]